MNTQTIINWIGGAALGALLVMGQGSAWMQSRYPALLI